MDFIVEENFITIDLMVPMYEVNHYLFDVNLLIFQEIYDLFEVKINILVDKKIVEDFHSMVENF